MENFGKLLVVSKYGSSRRKDVRSLPSEPQPEIRSDVFIEDIKEYLVQYPPIRQTTYDRIIEKYKDNIAPMLFNTAWAAHIDRLSLKYLTHIVGAPQQIHDFRTLVANDSRDSLKSVIRNSVFNRTNELFYPGAPMLVVLARDVKSRGQTACEICDLYLVEYEKWSEHGGYKSHNESRLKSIREEGLSKCRRDKLPHLIINGDPKTIKQIAIDCIKFTGGMCYCDMLDQDTTIYIDKTPKKSVLYNIISHKYPDVMMESFE
jgi:hypothetical protein